MEVGAIFESIQSGGFELGKPATFIRLPGCPFKNPCRICTSPSTAVKSVELESILQAIHLPNVIIIGCEPLMQDKGVCDLAVALHEAKKFVTIETVGERLVKDLIQQVDFWSLNPILPSMGHSPNLSTLVEYIAILPFNKMELRLSISSIEDLEEAWKLVELLGVKDSRIVLQPFLGSEHYVDSFCWLVSEIIKAKRGWFHLMPRLRVMPELNALAWRRKQELR